MGVCRICGATTDDLFSIKIDGKEYSDFCHACRKSIYLYHTTDNAITLDSCEINLNRRINGRELNDETKYILSLPSGSVVSVDDDIYTVKVNEKSNESPNKSVKGSVFWANVVNVMCKIFMVVLIVSGSVGGAIVGGAALDAFGIILGIILGGGVSAVVSLMTVSVLMMFVEMSKNVSKITEILSKDK